MEEMDMIIITIVVIVGSIDVKSLLQYHHHGCVDGF